MVRLPFGKKTNDGDASSTPHPTPLSTPDVPVLSDAAVSKKPNVPDAAANLEFDHFGTISPFRSSLLAVLGIDAVLLFLWFAWTRPGSSGFGRLILILVAGIPLVYEAAMQPLIARMAIRHLKRAPIPALHVLVSTLLATSIATTAFSITDGAKRATPSSVREQLGPVDEIIVASSADDRVEMQRRLTEAMNAPNDLSGASSVPWRRYIESQLDLIVAPVIVRVGQRELSATAIELDVENAKKFGDEPEATGFAEEKPLAAGAVSVGTDLASDVNLAIGSDIELSVGGGSVQLKVASILARRGLAGLSINAEERPRLLFVAPGTLVTAAQDRSAFRYLLAVSNVGGVLEGMRSANTVNEGLLSLAAATVGTNDALDGTVNNSDARPAVNAQIISAKDRLGQRTKRFLTPLIDLVRALSGLLLLASLVVLGLSAGAFASARRRDLATLRSLGFSRAAVLASVAIEGWVLALVGSILGSLLGAGVATLAFATAAGRGATLSFAPSLHAYGVLSGLSAGFAVSLLSVTLAVVWVMRHAVRGGYVEPMSKRATRSRRVLALAFAIPGAIAVGLLARDVRELSPLPILISVSALLALLGFVLRRVLPEQRTTEVISLLTIVVMLAGPFLWTSVFRRSDPGLLILQVIVTAIAGSIFVNELLARRDAHADKRWSAKAQSLTEVLGEDAKKRTRKFLPIRSSVEKKVNDPLAKSASPLDGARTDRPINKKTQRFVGQRLARAYVPAQRTRQLAFVASTAILVAAVLGVPMLTATLRASSQRLLNSAPKSWVAVADLPNAPQGLIERFRAESNAPETGVESLALSVASIDASMDGHHAVTPTLAVLPSSYPAGSLPQMSSRLAKADDAAILQQLLQAPDTAMVDASLLVNGDGKQRLVHVGDLVSVSDPISGRSVSLKTIAVSPSLVGFGSIVVGPAAASALFPSTLLVNRFLVRSIDPISTFNEATLRNMVERNGGTLTTMRALSRSAAALPERVGSLFQVLLVLTGTSALLSLGLLCLRSVIDRRKQFATMRLLGVRPHTIALMLRSELLRTIVIGTLLGSMIAVAGVWRFVWAGAVGLESSPSFSIQWILFPLIICALIVFILPRLSLRRLQDGGPSTTSRRGNKRAVDDTSTPLGAESKDRSVFGVSA